MQNMIKNIFVKNETKGYCGHDMGILQCNLINKLEGFDNKETLAKIESTYLNLKKVIQNDFRSLTMINTKYV